MGNEYAIHPNNMEMMRATAYLKNKYGLVPGTKESYDAAMRMLKGLPPFEGDSDTSTPPERKKPGGFLLLLFMGAILLLLIALTK